MARILRSAQSEIDYLEIWVQIAQPSQQAADQLIERFDERLAMLAGNPLAGRARDELRPGLRSFPVHSYVIIYRPVENGIELVRVLHGQRDIEQLFVD